MCAYGFMFVYISVRLCASQVIIPLTDLPVGKDFCRRFTLSPIRKESVSGSILLTINLTLEDATVARLLSGADKDYLTSFARGGKSVPRTKNLRGGTKQRKQKSERKGSGADGTASSTHTPVNSPIKDSQKEMGNGTPSAHQHTLGVDTSGSVSGKKKGNFGFKRRLSHTFGSNKKD